MHPRLVALSLMVGPLVAQPAVVPAAAASRDGSTNCSLAGFVGRHRQQTLIGSDLLRQMVGRSITDIAVRRDGSAPALSVGAALLTVRIGPTPFADVESLSSRFDDNLGPAGRVVFSGMVQLPAAPSLPNRNAATWMTPDAVSIPFAAPYACGAGTLCVQIDGEPVVGSESAWWPVDAEWDGIRGRRIIIGDGCGSAAANASHTATVSERELRPDSTARLQHLAESGALTVAAIAGSELSNPIELSMLGAPGCWLHLVPDVTLPLSVRGDPLGRGIGSAHLPLRLPNAPASLGAAFYVQWFDATARGIAASNALRLEIASSALGLQAAMVTSRREDTGPLPGEGRIEMGVMPVLRFGLQ
ncbi:MAG: hypothetical protein R3F56_08410 [Planctomycetota bacterium]